MLGAFECALTAELSSEQPGAAWQHFRPLERVVRRHGDTRNARATLNPNPSPDLKVAKDDARVLGCFISHPLDKRLDLDLRGSGHA